MEELQEESRAEGRVLGLRNAILRMQGTGKTLQQIAELLNYPLSEIETLVNTPATVH